MIYDAGSQNRQLSEAGTKPKDTSHRTEAAVRYSGNVTKASKSTNDLTEDSDVKFSPSKSAPTKASWEGYSDSRGTLLQPNNFGYANQAIQSARYKNKNDITEATNNSIPSIGNNKQLSGIMTNYSSFTMKDSSSEKVNQIVKNNNMF